MAIESEQENEMVDVSSDLTITSAEPRRSMGDIVGDLRAAFSARLEQRRIFRQTLRELQGYSRRNLLDMGLDPERLEDIARRAARL